METFWAIDFGTTNTLLARWVGTHAETVALEDVTEYDPVWHTPLIPSAALFHDTDRITIGRDALAAEEALGLAYSGRATPLARSFKRSLARDSRRPVAEVDGAPISARDCATAFIRDIVSRTSERERDVVRQRIPRWNVLARAFAWARRAGCVNDLTMTAPVESFEPYRMELLGISRRIGMRRFQCLDEPVAAALGYGIDLSDDRNLLVVDFGGGTLDIAVVRTTLAAGRSGPRPAGGRHGELIAARGLELGGETVDQWVTDMACGMLPAHVEVCRPLIRAQAEAVKKELSGKVLPTESAVFAMPGAMQPLVVTRRDFLQTLEARGLTTDLGRLTDAVLQDAQHRCTVADVDAVLLVGGSTLLPGVRELYERLFGANRVHYWEPFEAVVKGAATFGAGFTVDQIVHHDYAIRVFNEQAQRPEYEMLIRRGTPYPTPKGFQTRFYAVAPRQTHFSRPVCEVGYAGRLTLNWRRRANDNLYWMPEGDEEDECVVALNEGDVLRIVPPGTDARTRLRIDFMIDEERYLCATVTDLVRGREIRTDERITPTPLR